MINLLALLVSQFKQIQFLDDTRGVFPSHFPIAKQSRHRCFIFRAARLSVDTRDCKWALCFIRISQCSDLDPWRR